MKDEKDIKVKQFAIAVKKNTLKRWSNLKTESLQERDDEKVDARGLVYLSRFLLRLLEKLDDELVQLSTEEKQ